MKSRKNMTAKSQDQILSEATRRLLKKIKIRAGRSGRKLSREELIRRGYSDGFIDQLEAA